MQLLNFRHCICMYKHTHTHTQMVCKCGGRNVESIRPHGEVLKDLEPRYVSMRWLLPSVRTTGVSTVHTVAPVAFNMSLSEAHVHLGILRTARLICLLFPRHSSLAGSTVAHRWEPPFLLSSNLWGGNGEGSRTVFNKQDSSKSAWNMRTAWTWSSWIECVFPHEHELSPTDHLQVVRVVHKLTTNLDLENVVRNGSSQWQGTLKGRHYHPIHGQAADAKNEIQVSTKYKPLCNQGGVVFSVWLSF